MSFRWLSGEVIALGVLGVVGVVGVDGEIDAGEGDEEEPPLMVLERSAVKICWTRVRNEEMSCAALLPYCEGVGACCALVSARSSCVSRVNTLLAIRTKASIKSSQRPSSNNKGWSSPAMLHVPLIGPPPNQPSILDPSYPNINTNINHHHHGPTIRFSLLRRRQIARSIRQLECSSLQRILILPPSRPGSHSAGRLCRHRSRRAQGDADRTRAGRCSRADAWTVGAGYEPVESVDGGAEGGD